MTTETLVQPAPAAETSSTLIRWFDQVGLDDIASVGGKNASLGEMYRALTPHGIRVPNGFAVTAEAYQSFLKENGLDGEIARILDGLDKNDVHDLAQRGSRVRYAILHGHLPEPLERAIAEAYVRLSGGVLHPVDVAVRSSATAEDLPDASFAGQQETYLNVNGIAAVLYTCKRCFASLFNDRAISYRVDKGFGHLDVSLSVGVQRMVRSDLATSGVMFTIDTDTGFADAILINASYGLGETIVQGTVNPDEYCVFKPTLRRGHKPILRKKIGSKEFKLIYDTGGGRAVKTVPVPLEDRRKLAIDDDDILALARWGCDIEDHYSAKRGRHTPMDIEWAKDGLTGELFIVQARPETVQSQRQANVIKRYALKAKGKVLASGRAVGDAIASGPARVISGPAFLSKVQDGDVLVTDKTDPDWEPVMKRAEAIVTNRGGRTCHAAIVSRELGLPAIVGTESGTTSIRDGQEITVSCAEGELGVVYDGAIPFEVSTLDLRSVERPRTKIMMNVADPDQAFALSFTPNDGVGLAREEFIISSHIKIHPLALLHYMQIDDADARAKIDELTAGYADKPRYFIDKLAEGAGMIAAAFYPNDVILRMSDFKTNEYANLIGGKKFEPIEENPMIGFRGASRYYDDRYRAGFALECAAVKKVRDEMGLTNLKVMIPFCRTVEEGRRVQAEMAKNGLVRGANGLEIYVMCEIPSNVVLADQFAEIFDGFSIGSNDLTQLTLGVDRDSEIVAHVFDERNEAVKTMIAAVIQSAKAKGRKIGICGQAPSDFPDFAQFLVEQGIDSMSLNPDSVLKTMLAVREKELQLNRGAGNAPTGV
jgi:pyruvate,water dikinase